MAEQQAHSFTVQPDRPLIGVPIEQNGQEEVVYFVDEDAADVALRQEQTQPATKLAGVWVDLDADAMLKDLDRLRHETKPTPPLTSH